MSYLNILSNNDILRVYDASIKILEETGVIFRSEEARDIFKQHGAKVVGETVYITNKMVENCIETCPSTFKQYGIDEVNSVLIGDKQKQLVVSTQNGSVYIQDLDEGRRKGTVEDYVNITKLCQASDVLSVVGGIPLEPLDLDPNGRHLQIMYHLLKHTDKPLLGVNGTQKEVREMFDMIEITVGKKDYLLDHPVIGIAPNPLSPLKYDTEPLETIIAYAKHRQPVYINACIMAGTTGPINLLGTVTQMNTEILAGLVLIQLINPGSPVVYVSGSTVSNMKNGNFVTGSPESILIAVAGIQIARQLYHIPTRAMAGCTDAKDVDCQAGYETMQNLLMTVLAGVHFINNGIGCLDSIMTTSYEKFMIDQELIKRVIRLTDGIDTSDKALSVDVIQEVAHSGGYMMHQNTFEHFRERWQPSISCWDSYENWARSDSRDIIVRANQMYKEILDNSPKSLLNLEVERDLRRYMDKILNP